MGTGAGINIIMAVGVLCTLPNMSSCLFNVYVVQCHHIFAGFILFSMQR